jgi:hypothetical protein
MGSQQRAGPSYGAGLTEADVRRFQAILRDECGVEIGLPEAWSRAIELLALVELVLDWRSALPQHLQGSEEFALPPT